MAAVLPFVGYWVYRALTRHVSLTDQRRAVAAGVGAYVGLNAADGTPLYAPFQLAQTIPTMALAHLTVAGPA